MDGWMERWVDGIWLEGGMRRRVLEDQNRRRKWWMWNRDGRQNTQKRQPNFSNQTFRKESAEDAICLIS